MEGRQEKRSRGFELSSRLAGTAQRTSQPSAFELLRLPAALLVSYGPLAHASLTSLAELLQNRVQGARATDK